MRHCGAQVFFFEITVRASSLTLSLLCTLCFRNFSMAVHRCIQNAEFRLENVFFVSFIVLTSRVKLSVNGTFEFGAKIHSYRWIPGRSSKVFLWISQQFFPKLPDTGVAIVPKRSADSSLFRVAQRIRMQPFMPCTRCSRKRRNQSSNRRVFNLAYLERHTRGLPSSLQILLTNTNQESFHLVTVNRFVTFSMTLLSSETTSLYILLPVLNSTDIFANAEPTLSVIRTQAHLREV